MCRLALTLSFAVATAARDAGSGWFPLAALGLAAVLALGFGVRRFGWRDGHWVRLRRRRRWSIGPGGRRLARALGFRYSYTRGAFVPGVFDGRFGPVLQARRARRAVRQRSVLRRD